ncbi:MAG: pyridoxamine 5'-phosphate oxidase [Bacteroidota bacterium]
MRKEVADIRVDYLQGSLEETEVAQHPIKQFEAWFEAAVNRQVNEPNAMSLATVHQGRPSVRIVLLKGFNDAGFVFYTNYESKKAQEMAQNDQVALTFFWPELERQIRIEGKVAKVSEAESDAYYQSRGRGSRISAWASPQSQVIEDRSILEARVEEFISKFEGQETFPKPEYWGGYRVEPDYIEFWQGRKSRLHDRITYTLSEGEWTIQRIAP